MSKTRHLTCVFLAALLLWPMCTAAPFNIFYSEHDPIRFNQSMDKLKANVVNKGSFPLGSLITRKPLVLKSTDDIFCPEGTEQSSGLPAKGNEDFAFFVDSIETCASLIHQKAIVSNSSMTVVVVKPDRGSDIQATSTRIRQLYDTTLTAYTRKFNVGFVVVDSDSFERLKDMYSKDKSSFNVVMDFRVVSSIHADSHAPRQQLPASGDVDGP